MKQLIKKIFLPNEFDSVVLAIGLCILSAIAFAICQYGFRNSYYYGPNDYSLGVTSAFTLYLGSFLGMATIVADQRRQTKLRLVLVVSFIVSLFWYFWVSYSLENWASDDLVELESVLADGADALLAVPDWRTVVFFAALFLVSVAGIWIFTSATNLLTRLRARYTVTRIKTLLVLAVVMGAVIILRNILFSEMQEDLYSRVGETIEIADWPFALTKSLVACVALVLIPGNTLNYLRPGWKRGWIAVGYLAIVTVVIVQIWAAGRFYWIDELPMILVPLVGYSLTFFWTHNLVACRRAKTTNDSTESNPSLVVQKKTARPSHWTGLVVIGFVLLGIGFYRYDATVLFADLPTLHLKAARLAAQVRHIPEFDLQDYEGKICLGATLGDRVSADVFSPIQDMEVDSAVITNCQSHVDFSYLSELNPVVLSGGMVSLKQLKYLKDPHSVGFYNVLLVDSIAMGAQLRMDESTQFFECTNAVNRDILREVGLPSSILNVMNNRRQIDYGLMQKTVSAEIEGGEISGQQIEDIGNTVTRLYLDDVRWVEAEADKDFVFNGDSIRIEKCKDSTFISDLLKKVDLSSADIMIMTSFGLSRDDLDQLIRVSETSRVEVHIDDYQDDESNAWDNIFQLGMFSSVKLDFGLSNYSQSSWGESQRLSKALMAFGGKINSDYLSSKNPFDREIAVFANQLFTRNQHWIYSDPSESSDNLKVFFPVSSSGSFKKLAAVAPEIAGLCLDSNWCDFYAYFEGEYSQVDFFEDLKRFTNLKELYLGQQHHYRSPRALDFIKELKSLEKLQIDFSPIESSINNGRLTLPKSLTLKELTLLAGPSQQTIDEIKISFPNLKRLVIVYPDYQYLSFPQEKRRLENELPGVAVEIYGRTQPDKLVPQEFKDHIEKLRQEIRDSIQRESGRR